MRFPILLLEGAFSLYLGLLQFTRHLKKGLKLPLVLMQKTRLSKTRSKGRARVRSHHHSLCIFIFRRSEEESAGLLNELDAKSTQEF